MALISSVVITSVVSGVLSGIADVAAQALEGKQLRFTTKIKNTSRRPSTSRHMDANRILRIAGTSAAGTPLSLVRLWVLNLIFDSSAGGAIGKTLLNNLVLAPAHTFLYFACLVLLQEGNGSEDVWAKVRQDGALLLGTKTAYGLATDFFIFFLVEDVYLQKIVQRTVSLPLRVWVNYVSHRPHKGETVEKLRQSGEDTAMRTFFFGASDTPHGSDEWRAAETAAKGAIGTLQTPAAADVLTPRGGKCELTATPRDRGGRGSREKAENTAGRGGQEKAAET